MSRTWRDGFVSGSTNPSTEKLFDQLDGMLAPGESVRLVAVPFQMYDEFGTLLKFPLALGVTTRRVVVIRKKLTGTKALQWPILDFSAYAVDLFMGGGPMWEVVERVQRGQLKFVFKTHDEAEAVAEYINSGVAFAREGIE